MPSRGRLGVDDVLDVEERRAFDGAANLRFVFYDENGSVEHRPKILIVLRGSRQHPSPQRNRRRAVLTFS
jgi:hypothetical protein